MSPALAQRSSIDDGTGDAGAEAARPMARPHPSSRARPFLVAFLATLLGCCLSGSILNFVVNPWGNYPTKLFRPLLWEPRAIKVAMMKELAPPEVLVLGSSSAMKIAPKDISALTGQRAFNGAVDQALVEDLYAEARYALEERRWALRELVVAVDVRAFNPATPPHEHLLHVPELRQYVPNALLWRTVGGVLGSLVSGSQTKFSLRALRFTLTGYPPAAMAFAADGLGLWIAEERQLAENPAAFKPEIEGTARSYRELFYGYHHLDPRREELVEELAALAVHHGAKVKFFMPPMHDFVVASIRQATRDFDERRRDVAHLMSRLERKYAGIVYRDFTEVASFGGDPDCFFDGTHVRAENAARVVRALWR